jgi:hypothetical protein
MKYLLECNGVGAYVVMQPGDSSDKYGSVQNEFQRQAGYADERFAFVSMTRMDNPETVCGIPYTWGLAGSAGARFELFAFPEITPARIKHANEKLRRERDAVSITVRRITRLIEFNPSNLKT